MDRHPRQRNPPKDQSPACQGTPVTIGLGRGWCSIHGASVVESDAAPAAAPAYFRTIRFIAFVVAKYSHPLGPFITSVTPPWPLRMTRCLRTRVSFLFMTILRMRPVKSPVYTSPFRAFILPL